MRALVVGVEAPGILAGRGFQRIGIVGVAPVALQGGRLVRGARAEVPGVAAAHPDLVDHAADGAAVFGAVAAGEGLLLLDGAVRQLETALPIERIGDVHAIDVIGILGRRSAAEHIDRRAQRTAEQLWRAHADTRCQLRDACRIARQRQPLQILGRDRGDLIGGRHVDRGNRSGGDGDGLQAARAGGRTGKNHHHRARGHRSDVRLRLHDLAVLQQGDGVGADGEGDRVAAGLPHLDRAVEAGAAPDPYGFAGSHGNGALDGTGGRLSPGGVGEAQDGRADRDRERTAL